VGLVYDPRELLGVTTARPRVAGGLQLSSGLVLIEVIIVITVVIGSCFD
jgi:hypothetical protein